MKDYKRKTTHEMARELLALPDVPLEVELWCNMSGHECSAVMTDYDPTGTAIICQVRQNDTEPNQTKQEPPTEDKGEQP